MTMPKWIIIVCSVVITKSTTCNGEDFSKINQASVRILQHAVKEGQENVCFSMVGLCEALSPVLAGTAGNTKLEVQQVFGSVAPLLGREKELLNRNIQSFNIAFTARKLDLKENVKNGFSRTLVYKVDFEKQADEICQKVNKFVDNKSNGLIKEIVQPGDFTKNSVLVITNVLLFKNTWCEVFDPENTKRDFFFNKNEKVPIMMMSNADFKSRFSIDKEGCTVLMKPYDNPEKGDGTDNRMFFVVLMPNKEPLRDFVHHLSMKQIDELMERAVTPTEQYGVTVKLPKFSLNSPRIDMAEALKKLGIRDLFENDKADISELAHNANNIFVSSLKQSCRLTVYEGGTIAVSASSLAAAFGSPPTSVEIKINKPFVWMIYDEKEKVILFCGTLGGVDNPSQIKPI